MGTYIGKDLPGYDTLSMEVYGNGVDSGRIKIEIYQDDNNTWKVEQDSLCTPLYDARFDYELAVSWTGWKTVEIPLAQFKHSNVGIGSDQMKLGHSNNTGGLLHFQLLFIATKADGNIDIGIDNIKLIEK